MGPKTLVALDTDHIKQYVFATNKLKEIRGASSLLDHLNRREMKRLADEYQAESIYTNGGSGMFLVQGDKNQAEAFARAIQQEYLKQTAGGATISFGVEEIPDSIQADSPEALKQDKRVHPYMRLLHYRLLLDKGRSHQDIEVLPSHPFMSPCDACGVRYAEDKYKGGSMDTDDQDRYYCNVCLEKRREDHKVKEGIESIVKEKKHTGQVTEGERRPFAWEKLIRMLPETYHLELKTDRPSDFNKLEGLSSGKDYMALIYADANQMGNVMHDLKTLKDRKDMAEMVDNAIYNAMSKAIDKYLQIVPGEQKDEYIFPFDILMIGGDDVMVVTPANVAMDVALTLAKEFRAETKEKDIRPDKPGCTLSVAVILAPVKYPFGLLHDLADSTLKYSKREGARRKDPDQTIINFVVVAGNTGHEFENIMTSLWRKDEDEQAKFYATLRPYSVEELERLRTAILRGKERDIDLGHTKLHQLREAVMKKNRTTSVSNARAVLTSWRKAKQWQHVYGYVYEVANAYRELYQGNEPLEDSFPRLDFPWFRYKDNEQDVYRSPLLDLVELYDFITPQEQKGGNGGAKK